MLNIVALPRVIPSSMKPHKGSFFYQLSAGLVLSFSLAVLPATAQPYVGVAIGQSEGVVLVDESATSMEINAGVALSSNFALEASYLDLGSVDVAGGELNLDGFAFMVVASMPVAQTMNVFAKVGTYQWESEYSARHGDVRFERAVDSGSDFLYGFGVNFGIADDFDAVLEYRALAFDALDEEGSNISLGVRYRFH